MDSTYTVGIRKVFKQRLPGTDFMLDPSHRPILTEDVDPFGGEQPVLGGARVQEQRVRLSLTLIQLRTQRSEQVGFSGRGGGAGPLGVGAAGAV